MHAFRGARDGQRVRLTFELREFVEPNCVLVFAFSEGKLVLAKHRKRGWEIPGGTIEPGERPIVAAIREVFEETGAVVAAIEPVGQYRIESDGEPAIVKTIYIATVDAIHPLPDGFETEAVRLAETPPEPQDVRHDPAYSYVMKDDVYALTLERIEGHVYRRNAAANDT